MGAVACLPLEPQPAASKMMLMTTRGSIERQGFMPCPLAARI
jgi:hypothetical protein